MCNWRALSVLSVRHSKRHDTRANSEHRIHLFMNHKVSFLFRLSTFSVLLARTAIKQVQSQNRFLAERKEIQRGCLLIPLLDR